MSRKIIGRYIVADSNVCDGKPVFRGTTILVADVLKRVAMGQDRDTLIQWTGGSITREAIAEALSLARQALLEHATEYAGAPSPD